MIKERLNILNKIDELSKDISKTELILDETSKILALEINPNQKETILMTAGCHGNEPAPVYAMGKFLEEKNFPKDKRIILIPCINPIGFVSDSEFTPEKINVNRDFKENSNSKEANFLRKIVKKYNPEFVVNLHEDPDETDFYIWVEDNAYKSKAEKLIAELNVSYFKDKDIHGNQVKDGIILDSKEHDSFEDYLIKNHIPTFCTETPGEWSIEKRIKVNLDILNKIVNEVSK
ncbi:M14 family metallocarboxypeptidase [Candidatus Pacearchaeota archaeon]|nr:M14 family metallocarboxypeptidase [Candidatus Pacearchaeota archaeon]